MHSSDVSRRAFLGQAAAGLGTAWLAAVWPEIVSAAEHAHRAAGSSAPVAFDFFSSEQAADVEAIAAQIVPTDETPGAREAGVVHFIDRALTTFDKGKQGQYTAGLAQLAAKLGELFPGMDRFAAASDEQQVAVLTAIEKTDFFDLVRQHTLTGFLCDPGRGGNRDGVGWKLIGFDDRHVWEPPFGFYDRDYPGWQAVPSEGGDKK